MIAPFLAALGLSLPAFAVTLLASLGIGYITYTAITELIGNLLDSSKGVYLSINEEILAYLNIAGFGEAFGIIAAAIVTRISIQFIAKLSVLPKSNNQ